MIFSKLWELLNNAIGRSRSLSNQDQFNADLLDGEDEDLDSRIVL